MYFIFVLSALAAQALASPCSCGNDGISWASGANSWNQNIAPSVSYQSISLSPPQQSTWLIDNQPSCAVSSPSVSIISQQASINQQAAIQAAQAQAAQAQAAQAQLALQASQAQAQWQASQAQNAWQQAAWSQNSISIPQASFIAPQQSSVSIVSTQPATVQLLNNFQQDSLVLTNNNGGGAGGIGYGEVSLYGDLPLSGRSQIAGCLPVQGALGFSGSVPAGGIINVYGSVPCHC